MVYLFAQGEKVNNPAYKKKPRREHIQYAEACFIQVKFMYAEEAEK